MPPSLRSSCAIARVHNRTPCCASTQAPLFRRQLAGHSIRHAAGSRATTNPGVVSWRPHLPRCTATADGVVTETEGTQPEAELMSYMKGLTDKEREQVLPKLTQGGYAEPGYADLITDLTQADLKELGVEPHALRAKVLRSISTSGPSKTLWLDDPDGEGHTVKFANKLTFDRWAANNPLLEFMTAKGCDLKVITTWEEVQDDSWYLASKPICEGMDWDRRRYRLKMYV